MSVTSTLESAPVGTVVRWTGISGIPHAVTKIAPDHWAFPGPSNWYVPGSTTVPAFKVAEFITRHGVTNVEMSGGWTPITNEKRES